MSYSIEALGNGSENAIGSGNLSYCNGINKKGVAVGAVIEPDLPQGYYRPCFWKPTLPNSPITLSHQRINVTPLGLLKVSDSNDAVGDLLNVVNYESSNSGPKLTTVSKLTTALNTNDVFASDINNFKVVVGATDTQAFIFNYTNQTAPILIDPVPDITAAVGIAACGVNDKGDVVGSSNNNGFFLPAGSLNMTHVPNSSLTDINNKKIAVGYSYPHGSEDMFLGYPLKSQPIWIGFNKQPKTHLIQVPTPHKYGVVTAINNNNDMVGICWDEYANNMSVFIYTAKSANNATDLNSELANNNPKQWQLSTAWDINDGGQIVGETLTFSSDGGNVQGITAYIASPIQLATQFIPNRRKPRTALLSEMLPVTAEIRAVMSRRAFRSRGLSKPNSELKKQRRKHS
jgi:hypothetical protein